VGRSRYFTFLSARFPRRPASLRSKPIVVGTRHQAPRKPPRVAEWPARPPAFGALEPACRGILPARVSQLFFFDAEKTRSMAADGSRGQVLGRGVKALLGLDVVERLISDATVLETSLRSELDESAKPRDDRLELVSGIESLKAELDALKTDRSELENSLRR